MTSGLHSRFNRLPVGNTDFAPALPLPDCLMHGRGMIAVVAVFHRKPQRIPTLPDA